MQRISLAFLLIVIAASQAQARVCPPCRVGVCVDDPNHPGHEYCEQQFRIVKVDGEDVLQMLSPEAISRIRKNFTPDRRSANRVRR